MLRTVLGAVLVLVVTAPPASAEPQRGLGHEVPAPPYAGSTAAVDWVGSHVVAGGQAFCVGFGTGDVLRTKWGTNLPAATAAKISYLLLRYGGTASADEAAALAHLLRTWTAAPRPGRDDLDPAKPYEEAAYDAERHLAALPEPARQAVGRLSREADAQHGPWVARVTAPQKPQLFGRPDEWTVTVAGPGGHNLASLPVSVALTDAKFSTGQASGTFTTPADGGPLRLRITPSGLAPGMSVKLTAPADQPVAEPVEPGLRVVRTGGEQLVVATARTSATDPGFPEVIPAAGDVTPVPAAATTNGAPQPRPVLLAVVGGVLLLLASLGLLLRRRHR